MLKTENHIAPAALKSIGYAAGKAKASLVPFSFERREPREHDVLIEIKYCGICHSDIHQVRDEWGEGIFPMVPGHEIAGDDTRNSEANADSAANADSEAYADSVDGMLSR